MRLRCLFSVNRKVNRLFADEKPYRRRAIATCPRPQRHRDARRVQSILPQFSHRKPLFDAFVEQIVQHFGNLLAVCVCRERFG